MLPSGVFYDSMARAALDFGCELNNYHGLFASYQAECGDLDYYVLLGPRVRSVTARSSVAETQPEAAPTAASVAPSGHESAATSAAWPAAGRGSIPTRIWAFLFFLIGLYLVTENCQ